MVHNMVEIILKKPLGTVSKYETEHCASNDDSCIYIQSVFAIIDFGHNFLENVL